MRGTIAIEKVVGFILLVVVVALVIFSLVYFQDLKEYFFELLGKL